MATYSPSHPHYLHDDIESSAEQCVKQAAVFSYNQMKTDGHWCLRVRSSISFTVQWLCIRRILSPSLLPEEVSKFSRFLLSQQNPYDGSWGLAPAVYKWPGDVSTSTEAYFGLKLLGTPINSEPMLKAKSFIRESRGVNDIGVLS
ncbi:hypothetical protein HYALB_00004897 [Hymenoscyphus albidus]|uniref:Squalene cyclase N-terminal domain-containing protein n=1 Tax=Hymenoscyphus albidus TaxID=595503 RepID=A0A9N9LE20_9HELO|nr:hypothetical protein HYALB_00004897 [Hymenoscyphus albidus]